MTLTSVRGKIQEGRRPQLADRLLRVRDEPTLALYKATPPYSNMHQAGDTCLATWQRTVVQSCQVSEHLPLPCLGLTLRGDDPAVHLRRKRNSTSCTTSLSKRQESGKDSDSESELGIPNFDPAAIVQPKDGTRQVPKPIRKYLTKHLRHRLTKEEREALLKEHPRPELDVTTTPKVDKYMVDFLGKKLPKEHDSQLSKIQTAVLACIRPLTSAWHDLLEAGLEEDTSMKVPATEVLEIIQRSLCLIGNASEFISQARRSKILEAIEPSWGKYATEGYKTNDTLFGKDFQASLTSKVEADSALSKAVSIAKRGQKSKEQPSSSSRKDGQTFSRFFSRGPSCQVRGRQGKTSPPAQSRFHKGKDWERGRLIFNRPTDQNQRVHEPRLPQTESSPQASKRS